VRLYGVDAVAVGTDGSLGIAARDRLAVDALDEFCFHAFMTLGAGRRNVEFEDRRFGVAGGKDLVRAVAVGADRGLLGTGSDGASMNTLLVGKERRIAVAAGLHDKFLAVASAASLGNIQMADAGVGVARGEQLVRAAVAIGAGCGLRIAGGDGLGVKAAVVDGLFIGVAGGAVDFGRRVFVRRGFEIGVAVDAGKHGAMYRSFEFVGIHVKADGLAITFGAEAAISVAGETIFIGRFGRGFGCRFRSRRDWQEKDAEEKKCAPDFEPSFFGPSFLGPSWTDRESSGY
jgi:hypothetical protein